MFNKRSFKLYLALGFIAVYKTESCLCLVDADQNASLSITEIKKNPSSNRVGKLEVMVVSRVRGMCTSTVPLYLPTRAQDSQGTTFAVK